MGILMLNTKSFSFLLGKVGTKSVQQQCLRSSHITNHPKKIIPRYDSTNLVLTCPKSTFCNEIIFAMKYCNLMNSVQSRYRSFSDYENFQVCFIPMCIIIPFSIAYFIFNIFRLVSSPT